MWSFELELVPDTDSSQGDQNLGVIEGVNRGVMECCVLALLRSINKDSGILSFWGSYENNSRASDILDDNVIKCNHTDVRKISRERQD